MQELCRLLGGRLFEGEVLDPGASTELREEKRRTDDKVRYLPICISAVVPGVCRPVFNRSCAVHMHSGTCECYLSY
jgi:hypothetical protein